MRRTALFTVAAILMTACDNAPTTPTNEMLTPSLATSITENDQAVPYHNFLIMLPPCTREIVVLDGVVHMLFHRTVDANGGIKQRVHINPTDVSGLGLVTGTVFHSAGVTNEAYDLSGPFPMTFTQDYQFILTAPGKYNNIVAHQTLKVDVDQDGNPIGPPTVVNFHGECK
jgi:hypothetical protein